MLRCGAGGRLTCLDVQPLCAFKPLNFHFGLTQLQTSAATLYLEEIPLFKKPNFAAVMAFSVPILVAPAVRSEHLNDRDARCQGIPGLLPGLATFLSVTATDHERRRWILRPPGGPHYTATLSFIASLGA